MSKIFYFDSLIQNRLKNLAFKTVTLWSLHNDKNHKSHGILYTTGKEIFTSAPCESLRMNITIQKVVQMRKMYVCLDILHIDEGAFLDPIF